MRKSILALFILLLTSNVYAGEKQAQNFFNKVKNEPSLLRNFLYKFPKGGDLHNHIDGAIYAENFIAWGAEDGKCINLENNFIVMPPCDEAMGKPALKAIQYRADIVNPIIDALSVRNYERRPVSGHNQFFSTFRRFFTAGIGREGDMLAEVSARAARQNIVYLELMQSWGMAEARQLALKESAFRADTPLPELVNHPAMEKLVVETIARLDAIESRWQQKLGCGTGRDDPGCAVPVRYLAQVIRVFPREQVLAQTILAVKLIEKDARIVGLNFVAPEDNPVALRDYRWQMQMIAGLAELIPAARRGITLHAGELALGLVPPEDLGWHIREAIEVAGARRIGHGIDVFYDSEAPQLMRHMAKSGIMVEINLTSNDVILGIKDQQHPFLAYRKYGVPMAFSTDDEGVSRIDLTHEYQRAVETYELEYKDLKNYSRNALTYSFLAGESLLDENRRGGMVSECTGARPGKKPADEDCSRFLSNNEKARWQWDLEKRFVEFEQGFK